jgi:hypothetical protein|tara:strand:- start:70 stop:447 length:378 start_codon:yes stop_codon:yes gene_type:complete
MATLTGNKPKDTYQGLIKTADNGPISTSKQLSDGEGNIIPISVSTTSVAMTGTVTANGESLTSFTHDQSITASSTWTITHNMGKYPSVTVVDSANSYVIGNIEYINSNSLTVSFKNAFKGKAYLN